LPTDAELLADFLADRDETAFTELVRRHGPMVLGVCRRGLRSDADAEDAFQATFIVLARRAADIRPAGQVGRWLYGVARRTTLKARARAARRRAAEAVVAGPEPVARPVEPDDVREVIDEELSRLPPRLLAPVVLCAIEGRPYRAAARDLGIPEGTLSNRLAAARRTLAGRLARRGVTLPAAGLGVLFTAGPAQAVSPTLAAVTVEAAVEPVFPSALAEGVMSAMRFAKLLRVAFALFAVAAVAGCGVALLADGPPDKDARAIEGEWSLVAVEDSGKPVPTDQLKGVGVTINDGKMTVSDNNMTVAIRLDSSVQPHVIDLTGPGQTRPALGIYELDGDTLRICWATEEADARPKVFRTTATGGGKLIVLKRAKPVGR